MYWSPSDSNKKINMQTILELKQRRQMTRETGTSLSGKRDETIKRI